MRNHRIRSLPTLRTIVASGLFLLAVSGAHAGSIALEWDAVPGAIGYRVYYGDTAPGEYSHVADVGNTTTADLEGLQGCRRWYAAVKAYNAAGESLEFSNEIAGATRPEVLSINPGAVTQGGQIPIEIRGWTFKPGAELTLEADSVPTDANGEPLFRLEDYTVVGCGRIDALVTIEPLSRGVRAMPIGDIPLEFTVVNFDSIWGTDTVPVQVDVQPERLDINRSNATTEDRADGQDLVWLTYAFGSSDGDPRFNPDADLDGSGHVDGGDVALLASVFGLCREGSEWSSEACS